ncbi:uncharacterized protein [Scyliorhinus torazame]|uniref:uncharacterized protein n=1 Tax=Scyliorhinus torazame TaxID=75743 RepID=UPI003B5B1FF8
MSEAVDVTISDPLAKPRAVLDQWTGVYVRGETLTITCTVTGDHREKYFNFYKDKQRLSFRQIDRKNKIGPFRVTDRSNEGRYACQYGISAGGRQLISPMSETVDVTISDPLKKPRAVLDQSTGVYVRGETLTINCTVTGDNREKYFNFYKDKQRLSSRQIVRNDNFGTFRATGRRSEGRYACQYEISVSGRQLISRMSETVEVTISGACKCAAKRLQCDFDRLAGWEHTYQMRYNVGKCDVTHFGGKYKKADCYLYDDSSGNGELQRDLGVMVEQSLMLAMQLQSEARKANGMLAFIARGF